MEKGVLAGIEPENVFKFFEDLTRIPRPSYHEKEVSDYLVKFAKDRGLDVVQDDLYNVIITKPASKGYEDKDPLIFQGHMDMVCEKDPGCTKDMEKEGLDLLVNGDYISAKGTSLGGDDGIGVALALAFLDDKDLEAPELQFICTVSEEVGMEGAHGIDCSPIHGHKLINLDSEVEGTVLAGCAGGGRANITLPLNRVEFDGKAVEVHINGLTGGHSGAEIDKGRASAFEITSRLLNSLRNLDDMRIIGITGGGKDNAIPKEAYIYITADNVNMIFDIAGKLNAALADEYSVTDKDIKIEASEVDNATLLSHNIDCGSCFDRDSTNKITGLLASLPSGIQRMSSNVPGLVETSLNWGIFGTDEYSLNISSAVRSSVGTAYDALVEKISAVADGFSAVLNMTAEYPAWEWVQNSSLRDSMAKIYKDMFGKELKIEAIHAGVECGLLADKIPDMDAISMGPDIFDIHTSNEHLSISSTKRTYDFLKALISARDFTQTT
ncbi:MAG: aminoacyl-histidine dipeptidase [Lachnospiraceae bacterium]|jgi:dipeptidase D|nr:aminoacyl-histidine dipeptidase [Lachnospiraceae bacterium]MEE3461490.1 aminoacyl-histidine dipeptidase [Lachnospiraceae bacterium]